MVEGEPKKKKKCLLAVNSSQGSGEEHSGTARCVSQAMVCIP